MAGPVGTSIEPVSAAQAQRESLEAKLRSRCLRVNDTVVLIFLVSGTHFSGVKREKH